MIESQTEWKVARFFCKYSSSSFFVKELSRKLGIAPGSSSVICKKLEHEGILKRSKRGNMVLYSLDNERFLAREVKKLVFIFELHKLRKIFENEAYQSVALYGSYSSGEYAEKSDIDLLVITNSDEKGVADSFEPIRKLGDLSLRVLTLAQWREFKSSKQPFYFEVIANHTLLWGGKLLL